MQSTDFDLIKDIPGYKVILKTVLKKQIQQLVSAGQETLSKIQEIDFYYMHLKELQDAY